MNSEQTTATAGLGPESAEDRRVRRSAGMGKAFRAVKARHSAQRSQMDIIADRMIAVASSTAFLVIHAIAFIVWIAWNLPSSGLHRFDPYPFGMLTTIVSLEAIFLSIFVLMTQSREAHIGELREELTLQVNLKMEEELTKTLHLVAGLYSRLGLTLAEDPDLRGMLEPLDPAAIESELTDQIQEAIPHLRARFRHHQGGDGAT